MSKTIVSLVLALTLAATDATVIPEGYPVTYSTYAGGSSGDLAWSVATDVSGNAVIAGRTFSTDFPVQNAFQALPDKNENCFLLMLNPLGERIFSTYFGGSGDDGPACVRLDGEGNIYIAGFSHSTDLPTTVGALQEEYNGGSAFGNGDGFIAKFSPDGSQLIYCSYFGGSGDDIVMDLRIAPNGEILLAGTTDSSNLPEASAEGVRGKADAFVARLSSGADRVLWCRVFAGTADESNLKVGAGINDVVWFSGTTLSTNLPVSSSAYRPQNNSSGDEARDGFYGAIKGDGTVLKYLTYFGSEVDDAIFDLAVGTRGEAVIVGTSRGTAPGRRSTFAAPNGLGPNHAYVTRVDPVSSEPDWSCEFGGSGGDVATTIAPDSEGNFYVGGLTESPDFPLKDSLWPKVRGPLDGFVVKLSSDGAQMLYSSVIGGVGRDSVFGIAAIAKREVVLAGMTSSFDFPLRHPFQFEYRAGPRVGEEYDGFIMRLKTAPIAPPLEVTRSGNSLIVSWSTNAVGFTLESCPNLNSREWKRVVSTPVSLGERKAVVLKPQTGGSF